jgi:hypothetical protein
MRKKEVLDPSGVQVHKERFYPRNEGSYHKCIPDSNIHHNKVCTAKEISTRDFTYLRTL